MAIPPLTDLYIDETYPRLVQTNDTRTEFADGLGNSITFGQTPTGSLLTTASAAGNTITFTKGDGSTFPVTVTGGSGTPGDGDQAIQFNSASVFSGSAKLKYDYINSNIILTGSLLVTQSHISTIDYVDFSTRYDTVTPGIVPSHVEGRLFYDTGSQTLCMYNNELNVTLNIGQESWLRARNQTGVTITNGSVVKISGAVGSRPSIVLAQSTDQVQTFGVDNDIIGMATYDIEQGTDGFITTFGLVNGVDTAAFAAGDLLWVSQSAGQYTNIPPSAPYDKTFVGVVTRSNKNNGTIFITPQQPLHFHDISSVSQSGAYTQGDIWMFRQSGSSGVWTNTKILSGSYTLSGSLTTNDGVHVQTLTASIVSASQITGSLFGTASWTINALTASYAPDYVLNSSTSSFVLNSQTSSFITNSQTSSMLAPYVLNSQTSSFIQNSQTSSFVQNSQTSSFVLNSQTSSFVLNSQTSSMLASYVLNSQTSSFIRNSQTSSMTVATASFITSSRVFGPSGANSILSASYAQTSSNILGGQDNYIPLWNGSSSLTISTIYQSDVGYVGINNTNPQYQLDVNGDANFQTIYNTSQQQGYLTQVVGGTSHAEGQGTITLGNASHAEGVDTRTGKRSFYVSISGGTFNITGQGDLTSYFGKYIILDDNDYGGNYGRVVLSIQSITFFPTDPGNPIEYVTIVLDDNTIATDGLVANTIIALPGSTTPMGGTQAHSEGNSTMAIGYYSHAEGIQTVAVGDNSHAEGEGTITYDNAQHTTGRYNLALPGRGAFIIGNGTSDTNRSNLLYASGSQIQITGSLTVSGSSTFTNIGPAIFSGSVTSIGGFTGSLQGTASWATNFVGASNYVLNNATSSFVLNSQTSSFVTNSQTSSFVLNSQTSSMTVATASFITSSRVFGPSGANSILSASFAVNSTQLNGQAASFYQNASNINAGTISNTYLPPAINVTSVTASLTGSLTGALIGTASWATNFVGASSYVLNSVTSSMTVGTASRVTGGTANYIPLWSTTTSLGSSVLYQSGTSIGLGTISPNTILHISGASAQPLVNIENATPTGYTNMRFTGTGKKFVIGVGNASETTFGVANDFFIYDDSSGSIRMIIDTNGVMGIGTVTTGTEATLYLGAKSTSEGGQITLQSGTTQASASHLDNFSNSFRILRGNNTQNIGTSPVDLQLSHVTGQLQLPKYSSATSFTSTTATASLAVDSSGNVLTVAFFDSGLKALSSGISWVGTTPPSGTTEHSYRWTRVGNMVTISATLYYGTAGATLTGVNIALPSDCPAPYIPTNMNSANRLITVGSGICSSNYTNVVNIVYKAGLRVNSGGTGNELYVAQTSAGTALAYANITVTYFTA